MDRDDGHDGRLLSHTWTLQAGGWRVVVGGEYRGNVGGWDQRTLLVTN